MYSVVGTDTLTHRSSLEKSEEQDPAGSFRSFFNKEGFREGSHKSPSGKGGFLFITMDFFAGIWYNNNI